jgi:glycosyltransferase involved in cell wall biosynthesis
MSKILFLGPLTNRKNPEQTGGAIVLFEQIITQCLKNNTQHDIIDTNKKNYPNFIVAYISITLNLLRNYKKYDVISLHSTKDYLLFGLISIFLSKLSKITTSLHLFGGDATKVYLESNFFKQKLLHFIFSNMNSIFLELKVLVAFFQQINPNTYWLPNLRTKKLFVQSPRNFRKKFVFISQIKEVKGIDQLLEASDCLDKDYIIDIYGPIVDSKYTSDYFSSFHASYKQALKADEVIKVLNQYDVLVLPTYFKGEGYPGIIIEAYSLGIPVIATALEGIKEITDDHITGILIEPKNVGALVSAFRHFDTSNYLDMSSAAHRKFDDFDADTQTKRFIDIITKSQTNQLAIFSFISKIFRICKTVRHLKISQIWFRVFYISRRICRSFIKFKYPIKFAPDSPALRLQPSIPSNQSFRNQQFCFLNLTTTFNDTIDWNYSQHGKLWTYNLNYFDFLHQAGITKELGLQLIHGFIDQYSSIKDGFEPFPLCVRGINWIKFLTYHEVSDKKINDFIFTQYYILIDNLEYHLLGNHLLENAFSLLFGAYYFQDESFYYIANQILIEELEEQILSDGAHFELSTMYHQIVLNRLLDCINLIKNNHWKNNELLVLLNTKASLMLGWLKSITYTDGSIPLLNDSANGIAPISVDLFNYAHSLNIIFVDLKLSESGYRKIVKKQYECLIDIGNIGPDYIPGHSHSDTFSFELRVAGKQTIVDNGISTYETNERRLHERSTSAHNTVMVDNIEQSNIWGGFRVANRAKIIELLEYDDSISATHNGYQFINLFHNRTFKFYEGSILIQDIIQNGEKHISVAFLHFYPNINPILQNNMIDVEMCTIVFSGHSHIEIITYDYALEFNKTINAYCAKIYFSNLLETSIIFPKDNL